jgi:hypothetical protein
VIGVGPVKGDPGILNGDPTEVDIEGMHVGVLEPEDAKYVGKPQRAPAVIGADLDDRARADLLAYERVAG